MKMSAEQIQAEHEVCSNTQTVWVNSGDTGTCLGRFSKFGIDIHHDMERQMTTGSQCLDCTHSKPTLEDWLRFVQGMKEHYGVEVSDEHRPDWIIE